MHNALTGHCKEIFEVKPHETQASTYARTQRRVLPKKPGDQDKKEWEKTNLTSSSSSRQGIFPGKARSSEQHTSFYSS